MHSSAVQEAFTYINNVNLANICMYYFFHTNVIFICRKRFIMLWTCVTLQTVVYVNLEVACFATMLDPCG